MNRGKVGNKKGDWKGPTFYVRFISNWQRGCREHLAAFSVALFNRNRLYYFQIIEEGT